MHWVVMDVKLNTQIKDFQDKQKKLHFLSFTFLPQLYFAVGICLGSRSTQVPGLADKKSVDGLSKRLNMNNYNMKIARKRSIGIELTNRMESGRTSMTLSTNETCRTSASSLRRKKSVESLQVKRKPIIKTEIPVSEFHVSKFQIRQDTTRDETQVLADLLTQNKQQHISRTRTEMGSIDNPEGSRHQLRASSAPKMSCKVRSQTEFNENTKEKSPKKGFRKKPIRVDIKLEDIIMEHVKKAPQVNRQIETIFVKGLKKKLDDIEKQNKRIVTHPTPTFRNLVTADMLETLKNKLGTNNFRLNTQNTTCQSLNSSTLFR